MHRTNVGDIEITALIDMVQAYGAAGVYSEAGDALQQYAQFLDGEGKVTLNFACFLLRADGRTVLVDAGNGPEADGKLLEELEAAGVSAGDIDAVLFTHLHGDHTGWNLVRESGQPRFPNARYLVPQGDWNHYRVQDPQPKSFVRDMLPLDALGVMDLVAGEYEITPSLVTWHTPGHTPGHLSVVAKSGGVEAYVIGDALLTPIDVAEPDWVTTWDWDAEHVRATRRALIERVEASNALVAASHLPVPGLGHLATEGGRRVFQPLG
ncbi:MAG: MBL fold metallo-hydrolase [Dehalococcoidia bacterium]